MFKFFGEELDSWTKLGWAHRGAINKSSFERYILPLQGSGAKSWWANSRGLNPVFFLKKREK